MKFNTLSLCPVSVTPSSQMVGSWVHRFQISETSYMHTHSMRKKNNQILHDDQTRYEANLISGK